MADSIQPNGGNEGAAPQLASIIQALDVIHSPASTNEVRKQASEYLEQQKHEKSAIQNGYFLAAEKSHSPVVQHFGLSLLEHVLRYRFLELSPDELIHTRRLVMSLAEGLRYQDPPYIRNKVASLWVELAKRTWGLDWREMDESLVQLWGATFAHKELVLTVLETLSEDIIHQEDTASSLRGTDLNRALVEICTPHEVFKEAYPTRDHNTEIRCGSEGWLFRISSFLDDCIRNLHASTEAKSCALKCLSCLRSLVAWAIPMAIASSECITAICRALVVEDDAILLAVVEALHSLYGRSTYDIEEFQRLVNIIYQNDHLNLLRKLYEWSIVSADNIAESKYSISKKLSELISYISGFLEEKNVDFTKSVDLPSFFSFLISILQHPSLVVSIPVLHSWSRLLASDQIGGLDVVNSLIGQLLEICSLRLVRYEALPEDSDDPTVIFLSEDIDTIPERHAFVGNYRRYCSQVIEVIVQKHALEAIPHILSRVDNALNNIYAGIASFDGKSHSFISLDSLATFQKQSIPSLRADIQFTVVEAMLKGYLKWKGSLGSNPQDDEQQRLDLEGTLESWAMGLMGRNFEEQDPCIKQRVLRLCVDISAKALVDRPSYALKVLEHILMVQIPDLPEHTAYSESVKELYSMATYEIRRLAIRYADYFANYYEPLEQKAQEIGKRPNDEGRPQMELSAILLIIMQRARNVDPYLRQTRLHSFIDPIKQSWANQELKLMLGSFKGFYEILGLDRVRPYLQKREAQKIDDWTAVPLDTEGIHIQEHLSKKFQELPLRSTRTLLAVSTEKVKRDEPAYQIAVDLWKDAIPIILPTVLQLISHAHAFHNPDNWEGLPQDMRPVVGRILTDRFWQAGISSGSRQEFYSKIAGSKVTLEGLSSSVRGKVRAVREACYSVLFSMSRLEDCFYGFHELPTPLSQALYKDAFSLSSHQFSVLLNISRCLIDDCPSAIRASFLPPMMSALFAQLDTKVTGEWDIIQRRRIGVVDDDLTEEMKDESILRQLTYSAVIMVASFLDPQREGVHQDSSKIGEPEVGERSEPETMRTFILSSTQILEPVLLFCTHALQMHDTRCCTIITRVIRSILTEFVPAIDTQTAATIREFISSEVLKACINSVHDPYFVDMQKDLAQLISSVWILYGPTTNTPRSIMMSLPGMAEQKVKAAEEALHNSTSSRQQKAIILDLLEGVRGVRISEQGRILGTAANRRKERSAMQARYMTTEMEGQETKKVDINDGADLAFVADMFDQA
ncbi:karyopherin [Microsporum ferrugineum]